MHKQPVLLVTGGARRVGLAIAMQLAAPGRHLVLHYNRSRAEAEQAAEAVRARGASVTLLQADLADPKRAAGLVAEAWESAGRLDVLINNASIYHPTRLPDVTEADLDDFYNVNAKSPFLASQEFARRFLALPEGDGCIINLADTLYDRPKPDFLPYEMSKAALVCMTQGMATALAPRLRVNAVAPGPVLLPESYVKTDEANSLARTALGRIGSPEDIALAVEYLVFNAPYVTGHILRVDGGRHVV